MRSFAWFLRYGTVLLKTLRGRLCLALSLPLTSNYFHVRVDAGLFIIYQASLELSFECQLIRRQRTCSIALHISGKIRAAILL